MDNFTRTFFGDFPVAVLERLAARDPNFDLWKWFEEVKASFEKEAKR